MAPPSPRRSSRARVPNSQSQSSSGTSGRLERNPRTNNKTPSGKSTPSASLSSEPLEDLDDTLLARRRTRGQEDAVDKAARPETFEMPNGAEDLQDDEDEAVRCICDAEEYPGRPPVEGGDADFFSGIEFTEDVTGFFVQCDICKVWQHGACVGIFSAEMSPDEYFCEQCRKDLHKIHTASNGQKYSKYLPLHRTSPANSRATSVAKDRAQSPQKGGSKNTRPMSASQAAKRRSTMNSRDAAYDDEQLRRAIEASKEETAQDSAEGSLRRTKRGRSDSEDNNSAIKRQRTNSQSATPPPPPPLVPPPEAVDPVSLEHSEDEAFVRNGTKKVRNGRSQREQSTKEDKERQRQEAATKRKGRAERRRGEDSDPSEELPLAPTNDPIKQSEEPPPVIETPPVPQPTPGTPPATTSAAGSSHKKGARSNHKKTKGKNQYTKDRDVDRENSPARSMSRDIQKSADEANSTVHSKTPATEHKYTSKSKISMAQKMSMIDMKRRVGAIMDFISRTQVDLAAEGSIGSNSNSTSGEASPQKTPSAQLYGEAAKIEERDSLENAPADGKDFKSLNCIEMMDVLTRDMVKWQNQYN